MQYGKLVKDALGIQLLDYADKCICDNDRKKDEIAEGAYRNKKDGEDREYQVEICEDVRLDDLADAFEGASTGRLSQPFSL